MPPLSATLPKISAPALRVTRTAEQVTQFLEGDLRQVREQAAQWVRAVAAEQIARQIELGNSRQYTAVVDGSKGKAVEQAERTVRVYFVTAVLARNLAKARRVLEAAVRRILKTRTGLLASGWQWYVQRGGPSGSTTLLGESVPPGLELRPGDALILAPRASYAWFANYNASRLEAFVPREVARARRVIAGGGKPPRRRRPPRGFGFMAYAARAIRPELRRIGVSVWPRFTTALAPPGTHARRGVPILVLVVNKRLTARPGLQEGPS